VHTLKAFSTDGKRLWDGWTGELVRTLKGYTDMAFSADGNRLASALSDSMVRLWDGGTGKPVRTLESHRSTVSSAAFSADSKRLASASRD